MCTHQIFNHTKRFKEIDRFFFDRSYTINSIIFHNLRFNKIDKNESFQASLPLQIPVNIE